MDQRADADATDDGDAAPVDAERHGARGGIVADVDPPETDDRPVREPIEPEAIDPEHAAFVLVGVVATLGIVVSVL